MVLPQPFTTTSPIITSFDFTDIANGLGFVRFWLLGQKDNSGTQHVLTDNNIIIGNPGQTSTLNTTSTTNFDSSVFNAPRTVKGVAACNLGFVTTGGASGTISIQLKKWDGSSATNITSAIVETFGATESDTLSFNMPCTETLIPQGQQLRVVVIIIATGQHYYGHEPTNRDTANITPSTADSITSSNLNIPFKIDL